MSNSKTQFIRILQDECVTKKGTYRIVTSIYDLVYRSEIFLDEKLIDALEEECFYLIYDKRKEEHFKNKYIEAHQDIKEKYCKQTKEIPNKAKQAWRVFKVPPINFTFMHFILLGVSLFLVLLVYIIKNSMSTPIVHMSIADKSKPNKAILQKKSTTKKLQHMKVDTSTKKPIQAQKPKNPFVWNPKEKLVLKPGHYFPLSFTNNSDTIVQIQLTGRILNESPYDEIVQFKQYDTATNLKANETKVFNVYLEPTYYTQFDKGIYTGKLIFTLHYGKEKKTLNKHFSFQVK